MRFLTRFFTTFLAFLTGTAEKKPVRGGEPPAARLARYILEKSKISAGHVNLRAFLPPPDLELSTFNIDDLPSEDIWRIGEQVRREQGRERLYGRADLSAKDVYKTGLRPVREEPPPRHVVLIGWPDDKALQKNRAQLLAAASSYVPR